LARFHQGFISVSWGGHTFRADVWMAWVLTLPMAVTISGGLFYVFSKVF
jgi:phosphate/sulfate permease